jgi:hypothetical protein
VQLAYWTASGYVRRLIHEAAVYVGRKDVHYGVHCAVANRKQRALLLTRAYRGQRVVLDETLVPEISRLEEKADACALGGDEILQEMFRGRCDVASCGRMNSRHSRQPHEPHYRLIPQTNKVLHHFASS